jgi:hypothetical protein
MGECVEMVKPNGKRGGGNSHDRAVAKAATLQPTTAETPKVAPPAPSQTVWLVFGRSLISRSVIELIIPSLFVPGALTLMGLDWFPHNLLFAQLLFGTSAIILVIRFVQYGVVAEGTGIRGRLLFTLIPSLFFSVVATVLIMSIQERKRELAQLRSSTFKQTLVENNGKITGGEINGNTQISGTDSPSNQVGIHVGQGAEGNVPSINNVHLCTGDTWKCFLTEVTSYAQKGDTQSFEKAVDSFLGEVDLHGKLMAFRGNSDGRKKCDQEFIDAVTKLRAHMQDETATVKILLSQPPECFKQP